MMLFLNNEQLLSHHSSLCYMPLLLDIEKNHDKSHSTGKMFGTIRSVNLDGFVCFSSDRDTAPVLKSPSFDGNG